MFGTETILELLMIIVRWLAMLFGGDIQSIRQEYALVPVRATSAPHRADCCPAGFPDIGWMTMRLDPVLPVRVWSDRALARAESATRLRLMPRGGA
jgi:hypothetical protein